jgi:hypothetical protein
VKPQLEAVLRLPPDSLTKEIKLTEDLTELFIKYQIPADLLACDLGADPSLALAAVKANVANVRAVIADTHTKEIKQRKDEEDYRQPRAPALDLLSGDSDLFGGSDGSASAPALTYGMAPGSAPRPMRKSMARVGGGEEAMMRRGGGGGPMPPPAPSTRMCGASMAMMGSSSIMRSETSAASASVSTAPEALPPASSTAAAGPASADPSTDLSVVPSALDARSEALDPALRPTVLSVGDLWTKKASAALLAKPSTSSVGALAQADAKAMAFDLLDALSRSGALVLDHAALHVVVAATHAFDASLVDTVVERNVNPVERAERSALVMATVVHGLPAAAALVAAAQLDRVRDASPLLFES